MVGTIDDLYCRRWLRSKERASPMPYTTEEELPESVREHLPVRAQHIFLRAFNRACDVYNGDEERAFRVAWSAVHRAYAKVGETWILRCHAAPIE